MNYIIDFYNEKVQADIMSLPDTLAARFLNLADRMRIVGANLGEPHTKALRGCESIPKSGNICDFGNEESMTYSVFFAVFSGF